MYWPIALVPRPTITNHRLSYSNITAHCFKQWAVFYLKILRANLSIGSMVTIRADW